MSPDWRKDVTALAALYLMLERNVDIPVRPSGLSDIQDSTLFAMARSGLVRDHGTMWAVTENGRTALKAAVAAQDVLRQFEIFSHVDLSVTPQPEDMVDGEMRPEAWDPRFAEGEGTFDLRLAIISWLSRTTGKSSSPWTIVFLQRIGSGAVSDRSFWERLPSVLDEVDAIVASSYKWTDLSPVRSEEESSAIAATLYAAGQLEQRKRDGSTCSGCNVPLAVFEWQASQRGESLAKCPCCPHVFASPDADHGMRCPRCSSTICEGDAYCGGCGATVDFSLPTGTSVTEEVATTKTTVWGNSYGYVSYGWLDPWDPYDDMDALGYLYYDPWIY